MGALLIRPTYYGELLPYVSIYGNDPGRRMFVLHEDVRGYQQTIPRGIGFVEAPDELRALHMARAGLGSVEAIQPEFYVPVVDIACPDNFCLHAAAKYVFDAAHAVYDV